MNLNIFFLVVVAFVGLAIYTMLPAKTELQKGFVLPEAVIRAR